MPATNIRLYRRIGTIASLLNKQMGIESSADADLGFIMAGAKDAAGGVTKFLCKDKPVRATTIEATDKITTASDKAFYFGASDTDGSWRIVRTGNNLAIERRESGSWVEKSLIEA